MNDVFVSYSSEDRDRVEPLVDALVARGLSVWWDQRIRVGEQYDDAIDEAVRNAACVVTVWTESSIGSRWVKNESMVGLERGVLVPAMLDPVEPPVAFMTTQTADLTGGDLSEAELDAFAEVVSSVVEGRTRRQPATPASGTRVNPRQTVLAGAAVVVAAVALWWLVTQPQPDQDPRPYLLVVPFDAVGADLARWEPFADQITREIIRNLRKISGLRVVAPPSAFTFKGNKRRSHIRGQLPDVQFLLDGSVSAGPGGIRITPSLEDLHAEDLIQDWTYTSRVDDTNFFTVQADIALSVSDSLRITILDQEQKALTEFPTQNLAAYEHFVNARQLQDVFTHTSLRQAVDIYDEAIELDPTFVDAHIGKADTYRILMTYFERPVDMLGNVSAAIVDALAVEPESAAARSSLGLAYVFAWRWQDAWKMLNEARARDPTLALTELGFALYYSGLGEPQKVVSAVTRAGELDPLNGEVADWGSWALNMVGESDRALAWLDEKTRLRPDLGILFTSASVTSSLAGSHHRATSLAEKGVQLDRSPFALMILAQVVGRAGDLPRMRALMAEANARPEYLCPYETAAAYVQLEDLDNAFALMDEAVASRSNCMIFARNDPRLEPMRGDPRFDRLLRQVGLDDAAVASYPR